MAIKNEIKAAMRAENQVPSVDEIKKNDIEEVEEEVVKEEEKEPKKKVIFKKK